MLLQKCLAFLLFGLIPACMAVAVAKAEGASTPCTTIYYTQQTTSVAFVTMTGAPPTGSQAPVAVTNYYTGFATSVPQTAATLSPPPPPETTSYPLGTGTVSVKPSGNGTAPTSATLSSSPRPTPSGEEESGADTIKISGLAIAAAALAVSLF